MQPSSAPAKLRIPLGLLGVLLGSLPMAGQSLEYSQEPKVDQVDDYHGTKVADPYRWLEDDNSPDVANWVGAENKLTFSYLERIPYRDQIKKRLEQLYNYPKYLENLSQSGFIGFPQK